MATWDITAPAASGIGETASGSSAALTPPGDFDGATIDSVTILSAPTLDSDSATDDTIGIRWEISDSVTAAVYGDNSSAGSDAISLCSASLGDSVSSDTITAGSAPSPAPTIAVAADWDRVRYESNYSSSMKKDDETCSWSAFTIRVTYTALTPEDRRQTHYRFATPITGAAHEAWALVGTEDTSFEVTLDEDYALILKIVNNGGLDAPNQFYQLECNVDSAGWNDVTAASSNVRVVGSGDTDNAQSSTERLTTSGNAFQGTILDEVDGTVGGVIQGDSDREIYYAITFRSADLSGGESILLRAYAATFATYDITAAATIPAEIFVSELPVAALTFTRFAPTFEHTVTPAFPYHIFSRFRKAMRVLLTM